MRGRRRGRNRPSPPSPPSSGATQAADSGGQGAIQVLDSSQTVDPAEDGLPDVSDDSTASGEANVASVGEASSSSDGGGGAAAEPQPAAEGASTTGGSSPAPASDLVEETGTNAPTVADEAGPPPVRTPMQDAPDEPTQDSSIESVSDASADAPVSASTEETTVSDAPATDDNVVAPTGRQPQAASGNPLPRVMAVANQKGGVGKTTTSVNLGAALAELGFRVLVIDLDPQGNATTGLGIDARNFELSMYDVLMRDSSLEDCVEPTSMKNLFVAPATIALAGAEIELVPAFSRELKLKRAIETVIDDFDFVLIDCPPSLGLITVNALAAADEVLVPIQCEYYALEGLSQLMRNVHLVASNLNPRLDISTIVLTMYDARTKLSDQVATEVRDHFGNKVCRIVIPRTVRLSEAPSFGQPITAFDPASRGAIAYRELAKEVSGGTS